MFLYAEAQAKDYRKALSDIRHGEYEGLEMKVGSMSVWTSDMGSMSDGGEYECLDFRHGENEDLDIRHGKYEGMERKFALFINLHNFESVLCNFEISKLIIAQKFINCTRRIAEYVTLTADLFHSPVA